MNKVLAIFLVLYVFDLGASADAATFRSVPVEGKNPENLVFFFPTDPEVKFENLVGIYSKSANIAELNFVVKYKGKQISNVITNKSFTKMGNLIFLKVITTKKITGREDVNANIFKNNDSGISIEIISVFTK
jgi:hypothetical protein